MGIATNFVYHDDVRCSIVSVELQLRLSTVEPSKNVSTMLITTFVDVIRSPWGVLN